MSTGPKKITDVELVQMLLEVHDYIDFDRIREYLYFYKVKDFLAENGGRVPASDELFDYVTELHNMTNFEVLEESKIMKFPLPMACFPG